MTKAIELSQIGSVLTVAEGTGSVGIGTTSPQAKLVVSNGSAGLEFNPNSDYAIVSYNRSTSAFTPIGLQGSYQSFRIGGVGEVLRIASDGSIGTKGLVPTDGTFVANSTIRSQNSSSHISYIGFTQYSGNTTVGSMFSYMGGDGRSTGYLNFSTNDTERLRIASNGQVLVGNYATHSSIHGNLEVNGNDGINISNATRTGTDGVQWRLIPHNGGSGQSPSNLRLYEGAGGKEVINITKTGRIGINVNPHTYANNDTALGLLIKNGHTSSEHTFVDIQNGTSESTRIRFVDGDNGIAGQIYFSHNTQRSNVGANCMGFFTGSNTLRFQVMTDRVKVHGSTDGVLELDTTDSRGSFIRFQENETSKAWVGCSEGIGTGGDQDDLGLRAVDNIFLRAGSRKVAKFFSSGAVSFHVNSDDHETFRFTTQGVDEAKLIMKDSADADDIVLNTGGSSWINGGDLGVNTTSPLAKLHVNLLKSSGSSTADRTKQHAAMRLSLDRTTGGMPYLGWGPALDFYSDNYDGGTQRPNARIAGVISNYSAGDEGGQLRFYTTPTDTATSESDFVERYRIDAIGKITHTGGHQAGGGGANLGNGTYNRINASVSIPTNSTKTLTFTGLQTGWMTIRIGGYGSAGHQAINCMYELGGYMTATYTYDVHVVREWSRFGSISTTKNASNFTVTLPNTSNTYPCWAYITVEGSGSGLTVNSN